MNYFGKIESLLNNDIILKFNKNKAHTTINATMLIYKKYEETYLHLFLNPKEPNSDILIPCSFFPRGDLKYIERQEVYKILSIQKVPHTVIKHEIEILSHAAPGSALSDRVTAAQGKANELNSHNQQPNKERNRER